MAILEAWADVPRPVIGMVHLRPLPGSPRFGGDVETVRRAALDDAQSLVDGGVHGLMIENFGDAPFHPGRVPAEVIAHMTAIAVTVRARHSHIPLGINVLRNDGLGALAVAHACGADFIRVNVLCGARLTDQGLIQGIAHDLMRRRRELGAMAIRVLADVDVKHSAPLAPRPLEEEVAETIERGLADAVIVSGVATGQAPELEHLSVARHEANKRGVPVLLGSGLAVNSPPELLARADGFIVGSALKRDGQVDAPVDVERVTALMRRLA